LISSLKQESNQNVQSIHPFQEEPPKLSFAAFGLFRADGRGGGVGR